MHLLLTMKSRYIKLDKLDLINDDDEKQKKNRKNNILSMNLPGSTAVLYNPT